MKVRIEAGGWCGKEAADTVRRKTEGEGGDYISDSLRWPGPAHSPPGLQDGTRPCSPWPPDEPNLPGPSGLTLNYPGQKEPYHSPVPCVGRGGIPGTLPSDGEWIFPVMGDGLRP